MFIFYFLGTKPPSPSIQPIQKMEQEQEQEQDQDQDLDEQESEVRTILPPISHEHVINHPPTSKDIIPKRNRPPTYSNINRWNTSTHVKPNPYLPDLADAYPRDPFTKMPPKRDAIEIYRLLQSIIISHILKIKTNTSTVLFICLGMSLADVKKFLSQRQNQLGASKTSGDQKKQRPVVYAACHVDDIQTLHKPKKGEETFQPLRRFDESGLHFTNDARTSTFFRQLSEAMEGGENTALTRQKAAEEKAKWALFEQYGPELIEFLTDRHGRFKRRFDKVFIT